MPSSKPFPNTFIVGAPKCGTSAMAAYLAEHPQAFVCDPKEPFFWSEDYPGLRARYEMTSLDRYLELFSDTPDCCKVIAEGSTNYLASEVAIKNILEHQPEARFVVMLRNPVEVVHAFHSEILFSGIETEADFKTAWQLQEKRAAREQLPQRCEAPQFLQYAKVANYPEQLKRFFSLVPQSNRHVILFDDFASDTSACFQELITFLGLSKFEKDSFERVNASHGHRFKAFSQLILNPPAPLRPIVESTRTLARKFRGGIVDEMKSWFRKPQKRDPLDPEFESQLLAHFANQIKETSLLLNRDLGHWGVDCSDVVESPQSFDSVPV